MESINSNSPGGFDESKPIDIDLEWEKFNNSLITDLEEEFEALQSRAEFDEVTAAVIDSLRLSNLPKRVVDGYAATEQDLLRHYTVEYAEEHVAQYCNENGDMDSGAEIRLAINCILDYYKDRELQAAVINQTVLCSFLLQKSNKHPLMAAMLTHEKKKMQAELLVHHHKGLDDPWQLFFDEAIDLPGLDFSDPSDQHYLEAALDSQLEYENKQLKRVLLIERAKKMMGFDDRNRDLSQVIVMTGDLIEMHLIAAEPVYTEHERTNRNEQLWEYGRTNGFDSEILSKIITLYESES